MNTKYKGYETSIFFLKKQFYFLKEKLIKYLFIFIEP
jgi:hypothetical protein